MDANRLDRRLGRTCEWAERLWRRRDRPRSHTHTAPPRFGGRACGVGTGKHKLRLVGCGKRRGVRKRDGGGDGDRETQRQRQRQS